MHTHRIPLASLDEDLIVLARKDRERVVSIKYDGDFADVTTEDIVTYETRVVE